MPEFPNLDYDPGPAQASYSRVGPQPGRAETGRHPRPEPAPAPAIQVVHHEMAEELGVRPPARRRHNRRKYRYVH